ncbi:MAG: GAF domain-containing protein [Candidatus Zixiibacteriota bacterium]|nr:MAG: GAF domain-containing protein [candidate division Zixibacteria bacterium]
MEEAIPRGSDKIDYFAMANELKALSEISKAVQEADISEDSFEEILKAAGRIVDFRSASLFLFSRETGKLDEICTIGRRVDLIDFVEFDMGMGISAWVAQKRRPILLNNLRKSKGGVHIRSFLSVPVVYGNEIMGVINLAHDEPEAFTRRDSDILGIVSTLFALLSERIYHKKFETCARAEIDSLNEQLNKTRIEMSKMEGIRGTGGLSESLSKQVANPLAIIAGNAQFLLMTMKNSSSSVIRRLKAIDKEASNIAALTSRCLSGSCNEKEVSVKSKEEYRRI